MPWLSSVPPAPSCRSAAPLPAVTQSEPQVGAAVVIQPISWRGRAGSVGPRVVDNLNSEHDGQLTASKSNLIGVRFRPWTIATGVACAESGQQS